MAHTLNRHDVAAWLKRNGFVETYRSGQGSGHRYFTHSSGVKIAVPGHGPRDLTKKVAGHIIQQLAKLGFSKARVRRELASGRKQHTIEECLRQGAKSARELDKTLKQVFSLTPQQLHARLD